MRTGPLLFFLVVVLLQCVDTDSTVTTELADESNDLGEVIENGDVSKDTQTATVEVEGDPSADLPVNPVSSELAGHEVLLGDARHAPGYGKPLEHCGGCHGEVLEGGPHAIPSCTTCHAEVWKTGDLDVSSDPQDDHDLLFGDVGHHPDAQQPDLSCTSCHGADLLGVEGKGTSCQWCHGILWNGTTNEASEDPSIQDVSVDPPVDHDLMRGNVGHQRGLTVTVLTCVKCHGRDLKGGVHREPSCYSCHQAVWEDGMQDGFPEEPAHDQELGAVRHAEGFSTPAERCSSCHGKDLEGGEGGQPACFDCHGNHWSEKHDLRLEGVAHAREPRRASRRCTPCHGGDLKGGEHEEPSCFKCHGMKWR